MVGLGTDGRAYRPFDPDKNNPKGTRVEISAGGGDYGDFEIEAVVLIFPNGKVSALEMITRIDPLFLLPDDGEALGLLEQMANGGGYTPEEIAAKIAPDTLGGALALDMLFATGATEPKATLGSEVRKTSKNNPVKKRWSLSGSFVMEAVQ